MELHNKIIIVPWDFTIIAEYALQHAVKFAKVLKTKIILLHIVKKEEEMPAIKDQLEKIAKENSASTDILTEAMISVGSIFHTISNTAKDLDAEMVVMGTHGIKGMQKYLGSWAVKVISNTYVPFVVVQEPPKGKIFNEVVYPVNFKRENKEILNWLILYAKYFEMKVKIFAARYSDRKLKKGVSSNILFAQKILDKKGIKHELEWATTKGDFPRSVIEYAKRVNPDIILVMISRDMTIADFLVGANEQYIIANSEKIPVMCLSPRPVKNVSGFMAGGG